jgi:hypothetical protein
MTEPAPETATSPVYLEMRDRMLAIEPAGLMQPSEELPRVYGAIVDVGFDTLFTAAAFVDGKTAVFDSRGGITAELERLQEVEFIGYHLLVAIEKHLDQLTEVTSTDLPAFGRVRITALTYAGRLTADIEGEPLLGGNEPLSDALLAALSIIDRSQKVPAEQTLPQAPGQKRLN